jgi:hypothetical protein
MIAEKRQTSAGIYDAVRSRRLEADRIAAVADAVKQKAGNPDGQCLFVLCRCGHSFCERCLNRLLEAKGQRCPYPSCGLALTSEDILRIKSL